MAHVCGCGRSVTGQCDGSHALTEEQWQAKLDSMIREEQELKDELDDE
jgi:CDGSH-type Zn-finger protein